MEPTGPYWLQSEEYWTVTVNPAHANKSKELDDNNQAKTDYCDAKVTAQLVKMQDFQSQIFLKESTKNAEMQKISGKS